MFNNINHQISNVQVTHSRITSPVLLQINLTDDPGNATFRSPIRMHYIHMIKYYYVWLQMQHGKLWTDTDCQEWCLVVSVANPASSPWVCDLGIRLYWHSCQIFTITILLYYMYHYGRKPHYNTFTRGTETWLTLEISLSDMWKFPAELSVDMS